MKKLMILAAFVFTTAGASFAQKMEKPKLTPTERAEKVTQKMKSELTLSDEQYTKLLALNTEKATEREAAQKIKQEEMKAKREAMKIEKDAYNAKIKAVLTQEQYIKYLELKTEGRQDGRKTHEPRKRMKKQD